MSTRQAEYHVTAFYESEADLVAEQSPMQTVELPKVKSVTMKDMPEDQQPRERAKREGVKALSDAELMAIIFATGIQGKPVLQLCEEMLVNNQGHLSLIAGLSLQSLKDQNKGIGDVKALKLLAALELGLRSQADAAAMMQGEQVRSSEIAARMIRSQIGQLQHEEFWALLLTHAAREIKRVCIGKGNMTSTVVNVRGLIRECLDCRASAMILFHNHPSGQLNPSPQDISLTRKIMEAAKLFDIRVNDHIIVTDSDHYSLFDNGKMPN